MDQYFGPNQKEQASPFKSYAVVFLIILSFFGGWYLGQGRIWNKSNVESSKNVTNLYSAGDSYEGQSDFQLFWNLWDDIKNDYVHQPVSDEQLFYGAMRGLLSSLNDPYSAFFDPEMARIFDEELSGSFGGIGVEIGKKNNQIVVITALPDTPGEKAGLQPGDVILSVDGNELIDPALDEVSAMIRGEENTKVILEVYSSNKDQLEELVIVRQIIENIGMRWEKLDNGLLHVKLFSFDQDTENLMNKLIREVQDDADVKGIILDMRNNPGGFLEMAIEVASEWIEQGVIVTEKNYNGEEREHHARGRARLADIPTVVLVNEGSASAAEIVAGALQDYKKATLAGETTFGKGSVQKYETLSDGSSYRLTIAQWFTPHGQAIDDIGIIPDVTIELTEDDFNNDRDPQLDKALELLL